MLSMGRKRRRRLSSPLYTFRPSNNWCERDRERKKTLFKDTNYKETNLVGLVQAAAIGSSHISRTWNGIREEFSISSILVKQSPGNQQVVILRINSRPAWEYLDAVVQRGAGWVHGQVPEGLDKWRPPALGFGPLNGQHVIGEDRPEGLGRHGCDFEPFGGQLDIQVCCLDEEEKRFVNVKVCARCVHVRASYTRRCLR